MKTLYECKRCGYTSVKRIDVLRHLKKKIACSATFADTAMSVLRDELLAPKVKQTTCLKCGKLFSLRTNMMRHLKTCAYDVLGLQRTVDALQLQLDAVTVKPAIVANNFGQEDLSYLARNEDYVQARFFERSEGVMKTIEDIYFHADHPENKTVRLRSMKLGTSEIFVDGAWKLALTKDVVAKISPETRFTASTSWSTKKTSSRGSYPSGRAKFERTTPDVSRSSWPTKENKKPDFEEALTNIPTLFSPGGVFYFSCTFQHNITLFYFIAS